MQLLAADALAEVVVGAGVGSHALKDEAGGAAIHCRSELDHEVQVAVATGGLLHRRRPVLDSPRRHRGGHKDAEPLPCTRRLPGRPALICQEHRLGANAQAFAPVSDGTACGHWPCLRMGRSAWRLCALARLDPRIPCSIQALRVCGCDAFLRA